MSERKEERDTQTDRQIDRNTQSERLSERATREKNSGSRPNLRIHALMAELPDELANNAVDLPSGRRGRKRKAAVAQPGLRMTLPLSCLFYSQSGGLVQVHGQMQLVGLRPLQNCAEVVLRSQVCQEQASGCPGLYVWTVSDVKVFDSVVRVPSASKQSWPPVGFIRIDASLFFVVSICQ